MSRRPSEHTQRASSISNLPQWSLQTVKRSLIQGIPPTLSQKYLKTHEKRNIQNMEHKLEAMSGLTRTQSVSLAATNERTQTLDIHQGFQTAAW